MTRALAAVANFDLIVRGLYGGSLRHLDGLLLG